MRITAIEEQKKNRKRCSLFIDGEFRCYVDREILRELNLCEGMEFEPDELNKKLEAIQYKSALGAALNMLARSSKTEYEIKSRLREKKYSDKTITQVLDYLKEINYINDESYAENYIRTMKDMPGASRRFIYQKLAGKGVDMEIIRQKLEESEIDDFSAALEAAGKRASGLKGSRKEKASKIMGYLYRKGFGRDVCRRVIEALDLEES